MERSFMKPITAEWVAKAEADFATAQRESRIKNVTALVR